MNVTTVTDVCVLSLAVATISQTTARSKVFKETREWVKVKNPWFGELVSCPYCTSHWVAFVLVLIYQPRAISTLYLLDLLVTAFAIVALAAFIGAGIAKVTFTEPPEPHKATEFDLPDEVEPEKVY